MDLHPWLAPSRKRPRLWATTRRGRAQASSKTKFSRSKLKELVLPSIRLGHGEFDVETIDFRVRASTQMRLGREITCNYAVMQSRGNNEEAGVYLHDMWADPRSWIATYRWMLTVESSRALCGPSKNTHWHACFFWLSLFLTSRFRTMRLVRKSRHRIYIPCKSSLLPCVLGLGLG